jgi:cyanate permease
VKKNGNLQDDIDSTNKEEEDESEEKKEKPTFWQRLGKSIVAFFDLGLLKDPIYVNLMLGMSLAICAELNFSLLTPFILSDRGFDTEHTAIIMSVIAGLDIVFRFLAPFFSDYYKIQARVMYIIALIMLLSSRTGECIVTTVGTSNFTLRIKLVQKYLAKLILIELIQVYTCCLKFKCNFIRFFI